MPYQIKSVTAFEGGVKIARVTADSGTEELSAITELLSVNGLSPLNTTAAIAHTPDGTFIAFGENRN